MSETVYVVCDYMNNDGKLRAFGVEFRRDLNFKKLFKENLYLKEAFYIRICETKKERDIFVEKSNELYEENNRLMSWDELTEVIK